MTDRRTFLRNISLLTLGGIASQKVMASNPTRSIPATDAISSATAGKKMGLQTYSLGQELLQDMPNGLNRLAKAGYTGDYNPKNTTFIASKDYKKMVDDAGLRISSSHLTPSLREYTKENMPKFDEFWKKATDIHAELGVSCMVQPSLPRIENEDDAKVVSEIFNRAGEITKKAGILWGYHNHSNEFKRVLKAGEKPEQNPNPWAPPKDPVEWMENYPNRFKLLHIKDRWIIGDSGMMNFPNIFKKAYEIGILGYYVELEGDKKGRTQFEGVEKSAAYLQAAPFVK